MLLDSILGPTLSCLVAEKAKFPNYNFPTTTTMSSNQVSIGEMELKKIGLRKVQAMFKKEDADEVEVRGKGRGKATEGICCFD